MAHLLLLNGPNLNLLGRREPHIYGRHTLTDIETQVKRLGQDAGHTVHCFQSNHEGALIDWLQARHASDQADFLLLNAAAYTHTSVALRDVLAALPLPFIEIHISQVYKREAFRHHSYLAPLAHGVISGLGSMGYALAAQFAIAFLQEQTQP